MKTLLLLSAAILVAGCTSSGGASSGPPAQTQAAKDAAALAEALSGRVAGEPVDCVNERDLGGNKSYGRDVILFTGNTGDVLYVNRPTGGCPEVGSGRALKTKITTGQLCRGDIVTVLDPVSRMELGSCALGAFTPYRRSR